MKKAALFPVVLVLSFPSSATAQTLGKYTNDGSNVVWFIQTSDTHINSTGLVGWYPDSLPWALGECAQNVNPLFIVVTGDLTDHTCGSLGSYLGAPCDEEWEEYRQILDDHGMTPDFYFDVPGNHDAYGEGALSHYLKYSVQGADTNSTQQSWRVDFPQQSLHFFSVATPGNDGAQWPFDNVEFTSGEIDEVNAFLQANSDAEFQMGFGHHDYKNAKKASDMDGLFQQYKVNYYSHGHNHDLKLTVENDNVLRFRIDALGQSKGDNLAIWALDNLAATVNIFDARSGWPKVVITAPADQEIDWGGKVRNPHNAPVPKSCTEAPVRALVFDPQSVLSASFSVDNGNAVPMTPRQSNPFQWRGKFDATALSVGKHTVTVETTASASASATNEFFVEDVACDLGPEDPDVPPTDGGTSDAAGQSDGGTMDAGAMEDGGTTDEGTQDDGTTDAGVADDAIVVAEDAATAEDEGSVDDGSVGPGDSGPAKDDAGAHSGADVGWLEKPDEGAAGQAGAEAGCSCAAVGF
ncbi:MAG: metallophosphoesterase [Deltaproteobacteria bacterium]|nr:metallophosphoesterase [Deltaproteobacteria bacterium]